MLFGVDGDVAHVETYVTAYHRVPTSALAGFWDGREDAYEGLAGGRYVDRFERRAGEWKIAVRNVIAEWATSLEAVELLGEPYAEGIRDRTDMSYQRPLEALGALTASAR
jgi:hypothetical protein